MRTQYGKLPFVLEKTDTAWHSFRVYWSVDGGETKIHADLRRRDLDTQLRSITVESIEDALSDVRRAMNVTSAACPIGDNEAG